MGEGGESKCFKVVSTLQVLKKKKNSKFRFCRAKKTLKGRRERRKEGRRKKGRKDRRKFLFLVPVGLFVFVHVFYPFEGQFLQLL